MVAVVDRLPFADAAGQDKVLGVAAHVPGGGRRRFEVPVRCEKRGHYRLGPVGLASSFPLGLAEARQARNGGVQTLTVYPEVFSILALPLGGAPSQIHRGGYLLPEGAGAAEFSGLREYRRGDNPRHVHWPTTARLNELMVREFEPLASACLCLALDLAADANVGLGRQATLEYAVRIAASMARLACGQNIRTRVIGEGSRPLHLPAGSGEHHYQAILDELAVVAGDGATPYARVLARAALDCLPGETLVLFLSEPAARAADTLQALAQLRARRVHLLAVVFDRASFLAAPDAPAGPADPEAGAALAALLDLGAHCLPIRRGDDLVRRFNP